MVLAGFLSMQFQINNVGTALSEFYEVFQLELDWSTYQMTACYQKHYIFFVMQH